MVESKVDIQLDSSLRGYERQSTWLQTSGYRQPCLSVVFLSGVRDVPSTLEEMPVQRSGSTVECRRVDHGTTSYLSATLLVL